MDGAVVVVVAADEEGAFLSFALLSSHIIHP
jgi:hypothetical protein